MRSLIKIKVGVHIRAVLVRRYKQNLMGIGLCKFSLSRFHVIRGKDSLGAVTSLHHTLPPVTVALPYSVGACLKVQTHSLRMWK